MRTNTSRMTCRLGLISVMSAWLLLCGTGCKETYAGVGNAYNALLADPEGFCDYVADHDGIFDGNFDRCINEKTGALERRINELQDECDEIFVSGEDLLACDADRGVPQLRTAIAAIEVLEGVADGDVTCVQAGEIFSFFMDTWNDTRADLALYGLEDLMPTWDEFVENGKRRRRDELSCRWRKRLFD